MTNFSDNVTLIYWRIASRKSLWSSWLRMCHKCGTPLCCSGLAVGWAGLWICSGAPRSPRHFAASFRTFLPTFHLLLPVLGTEWWMDSDAWRGCCLLHPGLGGIRMCLSLWFPMSRIKTWVAVRQWQLIFGVLMDGLSAIMSTWVGICVILFVFFFFFPIFVFIIYLPSPLPGVILFDSQQTIGRSHVIF